MSLSNYNLPNYRPTRLKKKEVLEVIRSDSQVISLLNVSEEEYQSWGLYVPPPYGDRLVLSRYGELPCEARYVPVESALIIFKKKKLLAKHFYETLEWVNDRRFLTELPSAYMLKYFSEFVQGYTIT